ncbi:MAG TPA: RNA polymerase sigma factor [Steroidobacteraceae bacterium]|nr:RNA polymerase sigma factor [Steroidobacteraceae bacterium]
MTRSATLCAPVAWERGRRNMREAALDSERALERFLAGIERRAFRIAKLALRDQAEAEDAVQDAMIRLVRKYAGRPAEQWRPLFYRILQNRITDSQRRQKVRRAVMAWRPAAGADPEAPDPVESAVDPDGGPDAALEGEELLARIEGALEGLPGRQREAFLFRNFEGMDVAQTAIAMGCSEGSVKTHYFRALRALQEVLGQWKT